MPAATADAQPIPRRATSLTLPFAMISIAAASAICAAVVIVADQPGLFRTLAMVLVTTIGGALMIVRSAKKTRDPRLLRLIHVWALKLVAGFAMLYFGWVPSLDPLLPNYGYDPQRYYEQAEVLRESGFNANAIYSIKYTFVLYVYGTLFIVFDQNCYAPALVNALVSLWGVLAVLRFAYAVRKKPDRHGWLIGLTLVIPEIIWFDNLVSRETLATSLLTVGILGATSYLLPRESVRRLSLVTFRSAIPSLLFLGVLRTSALAAGLLAIAAIYFTHRMTFKQRVAAVVTLAIFVAGLAVAPSIVRRLGGYRLNYLRELNPSVRAQEALDDPGNTWGENSIGRRLVGNTYAKLIFFAPIRMIAYVVLPLPTATVTLDGIKEGNWQDWQAAIMKISSVIYLIIVPSMLALAFDVLRRRMPPDASILLIAFAVVYSGIAIGNQILHERYRVMSVPLLVACAYLGRSASPSSRRWAIGLWTFTLVSGALVYAIMKAT